MFIDDFIESTTCQVWLGDNSHSVDIRNIRAKQRRRKYDGNRS